MVIGNVGGRAQKVYFFRVAGGVFQMGICKVAGGVLQVGFLKIGLWRFAGGIPLVRFLM